MFGLGGGNKEMKAARTGAREKLAKARAMTAAGGHPGSGDVNQGKDGKKATPTPVSVALIYVLSVAACYVFSVGVLDHGGVNWSTGSSGLDHLLFSNAPIRFFGDQGVDYVILMFVRGIFLFLAAGILPFLSLAWVRAIDNSHANPYRVMWGMPVALIFIFYTFRDHLWPLLATIFGMMR